MRRLGWDDIEFSSEVLSGWRPVVSSYHALRVGRYRIFIWSSHWKGRHPLRLSKTRSHVQPMITWPISSHSFSDHHKFTTAVYFLPQRPRINPVLIANSPNPNTPSVGRESVWAEDVTASLSVRVHVMMSITRDKCSSNVDKYCIAPMSYLDSGFRISMYMDGE